MRHLSAFAILALLVGCSSNPTTSGVSTKSRFGDEFKDAPEWVRTNTCAGSSVKKPESMVCGVGQHPIASRRAMGLARSSAAAQGRARIARNLSAKVKTLLDFYQGEWAKGVEDEGVDFEQRTREAVEEVAKLDLTGAGAVDSWISASDTMYVLVALDQDKAKSVIKQNGKLSNSMKESIDRHADELFDKLNSAQ